MQPHPEWRGDAPQPYRACGLGFDGVGAVRQGKVIELDESDARAARATVEAMCVKLLANTVIEDYEISIEG